MENIVLDTNCLIRIVPQGAKYHLLWDKIISGDVHLYVTHKIMLEYEEILSIEYGKEIANFVMLTLSTLSNIHYVNVYYHFNLIAIDPDDNEFVDCAIVANAKCIVSNDKHFKVLSNKNIWPQIDVKKLQEYCKYLSDKSLTGIPTPRKPRRKK